MYENLSEPAQALKHIDCDILDFIEVRLTGKCIEAYPELMFCHKIYTPERHGDHWTIVQIYSAIGETDKDTIIQFTRI